MFQVYPYWSSSIPYLIICVQGFSAIDYPHRWGAHAEIKSESTVYIVNYVIYVSAALVFAGLAGLFVTTLAPYAAGSGIPEVRERERVSRGCRCTEGYDCLLGEDHFEWIYHPRVLRGMDPAR